MKCCTYMMVLQTSLLENLFRDLRIFPFPNLTNLFFWQICSFERLDSQMWKLQSEISESGTRDCSNSEHQFPSKKWTICSGRGIFFVNIQLTWVLWGKVLCLEYYLFQLQIAQASQIPTQNLHVELVYWQKNYYKNKTNMLRKIFSMNKTKRIFLTTL